ncbi:MAG: tetratricopeptide repeat protein [Myxococcales bacterium]|nr:tetratricopeptide repeat protein [Myxococcales bacterium]
MTRSLHQARAALRAARVVGAVVAAALLVTLASPRPAAAQRIEDLFDHATTAAASGDYDRAVVGYEQLVAAGVDDPDVLYDLAVSWARLGAYPKAVYYFERALELRPRDAGARAGLRAARDAIAAERAAAGHAAPVAEASASLLSRLSRPFTETTLGWMLLCFDALACLLLLLRLRVRGEAVRLGLTLGTLGAAALAALSLVALLARVQPFTPGERAIVLSPTVALREAPFPGAVKSGQAYGGDAVRVLGRHDDFVQIRDVDGELGWAPSQSVGVL